MRKILLALALVVLPTGAALAWHEGCGGTGATYDTIDHFGNEEDPTYTQLRDCVAPIDTGTSGNNHITLLNGHDYALGGEGNDWIEAGGGDDVVYAGNGDDDVIGWGGTDWLYGERGDDDIWGGDGDDHIEVGEGVDYARGEAGYDVIMHLHCGNGGDYGGFEKHIHKSCP